MGSTMTHYAMIGIVLDEGEYEDLNSRVEYDDLKDYYDNGYEARVSFADDGFTIIADGMNGEYLVFGEVIMKNLEHDGLKLTVFPKIKSKLRKKILDRAEAVLGFRFDKSRVVRVAFTDWH